jgi:hypothetical protein
MLLLQTIGDQVSPLGLEVVSLPLAGNASGFAL